MSLTAKALAGKVAIVTGASSGNGRAISLALAKAGSKVVCSDLQPEARQEGYEKDLSVPTHELIRKLGGEAIFQRCDVSNSSQIEELVSKAASTFGRLDIMVNNAGIFTGLKNILEETDDDFDRTMSINTRGTYFGCKYAIKQFLSQSEPAADTSEDAQSHPSIGKIINIASMGGLIGLAREPSYCASKGAVVNLTRQLAVDFGPSRINVNSLCPGFLATAMVRPFIEDKALNTSLHDATPWPRLGSAKDVSDAVLFLASPQSDWVTGTIMTVDGGFTSK
ncbi:alcohol dehydrogenase [Fusarium tjaetaba]|uniref:Alcohol dehydrogenase n=1 Tax=Fusarium tjaetaba TaxID=1567544 RepID=A0A8H5R3A8_9HYPO|nr:alcohol dehydrogenase [Fusarium tjaetaba]KAF5624651.1 alcohol dehydrogenase [Fusarium tjaetaba]